MKWQDVCERPELQNLPFKIELNKRGQIVMSPVKVYHSAFQGAIARLLPAHGIVLSECAIKTSEGTKVADIAWASSDRFSQIKYESECSVAPEICIEVLSESSTADEMAEKKALYFAHGAEEVWFCDKHGKMQFLSAEQNLSASKLAPEFPATIVI